MSSKFLDPENAGKAGALALELVLSDDPGRSLLLGILADPPPVGGPYTPSQLLFLEDAELLLLLVLALYEEGGGTGPDGLRDVGIDALLVPELEPDRATFLEGATFPYVVTTGAGTVG